MWIIRTVFSMKGKTIILALGILTVLSCSRDFTDSREHRAPDGTIPVGISVLSGGAVPTRTTDESLTPVRVLAFDDQGYLVEQSEGYGFTYGAGADSKETRFSVDLTATSEYRRLHIIAGIDTGSIPFGSEAQLVGSRSTTGGTVAYWQCIELPEGISEDMSMTPVTRVPLVRNIAKISVVSEDPDFTLLGFRVVNTPAAGGVAAWIPGSGYFSGYRTDTPPSYATLHAAGYTGMVPVGNTTLTSTAYGTAPVDVYEHPYTGDADTYTYILLKGRLSDADHDSYYKLDIVRVLGDGSNEYMDIIRNIQYNISITSMGSYGYTSEAEAVSHPAGNNVSGSVNTEALDNISDGCGQLFVSATDIIIVDNSAVTFRYKYIPDVVSAPSTVSNGDVTVDAPAGDVLSSAGSVAASDAADGWRSVTLTPKSNDGIVRSQTIRLTTDSGLTKTVRLRLRSRYDMTVSVSPTSVDQVIGTPLTVTATLPEGLPDSVFPLQLLVSSDNGTVYPDPDGDPMPVSVETGSYGYIKEVSYAEYVSSAGVVTCELLTNKVKSAATVQITNRYFNMGSAAFSNNPRYVTSFTIPAKSMIVTGLSTSYNSFYLYYDSARKSRINSTTYRLYAYGPTDDTTITVGSMLSTDLIYFYNTTRRTTVGLSIEDLEEGGHTLKTN